MEEAKSTAIQKRLNRVAGQVAGVQNMVADDRYCVDILTQIAAIRSALDSIGLELLSGHLRACVCGGKGAHAQSKAMTKEELFTEVETVIQRFLK